MKNKLYVGGLPYSMTEDELREIFAAYGEVTSVAIITDKFSGQSKGFGFVEMSSEEEANKAIEALDGNEISGRRATVNHARPREER